MKKLILCLCFLSASLLAQSQYVVEVPHKMEFAGMKLHIHNGAKGPIKNYADKLTINNKYFRQLIERADAYMPLIERILQEEGLPDDFKYLVIQESSLVSDQVSSSNAVGFWQFKKETALEMGLKVEDEIDERMNIVASTRAAARYLVRHNNYMKNWTYSLLAYYAGLGGAKNLVDQSKIGSDELDIDENTHWYILKFLSYKLAFEENLHRSATPVMKIMEYQECENKTLQDIAQETNYPLDQILFYNKWAKKGTIPGDKDYVVLIPVKPEDQAIFTASNSVQPQALPETLKPWRDKVLFGLIEKPVEVVQTSADANSSFVPRFYEWNGIKAIMAEKGDNISKIAMRAELEKDEFLEYNDLRVFDPIIPGELYYIKHKHKKGSVPFYTVKPGETLWEISQNYGIKLSALLKKNRMDKPEKLKAGRVLWLRKVRPEDEPVRYESLPAEPQKIVKPEPFIVKKDVKRTEPERTKTIEVKQEIPTISYQKDKAKTDSVLKVIADKVTKELGSDTLKEIEIEEEIVVEALPEKQTISAATPSKPEKKPETKPIAKVENIDQPQTHTVASGQTLYTISKIYSLSVDSLLAWNEVAENGIKPGQIIQLKPSKESIYARRAQDEGNKPESKENIIYEVKAGDSLYRIAKSFGVKVDDLLNWNNKTEPVLNPGEKLTIKK